MKKALSLLLAAVMALTLCVTAFAGGDTGTRVYLTGDAADEVTGLTSGQRIDAGGSTTVRLNVQSDPGAEEYTVTLDGETLKADHSTAQYHVYSLPADKLTARTATLSVNSGVSTQAASANTLTVTVGDMPHSVDLSNGSTDVKNLTELSLPITNDDGGFKQIYISGAGATLYAAWSKRGGTMTGSENFVAVANKGFTKSDLYIYKTPAKQEKTVYITFDDNGTLRYYKLTITCPAASGYALGSGGYSMSGKEYSELRPGGTTDAEGGNYNFTYTNSTYSTWIKQENSAMPSMSQIGAAMAVYQDGSALTSTGGNELSALAQPDWDTLVNNCHGLYTTAEVGHTNLIVNRPGFYWFPVSCDYTGSEDTTATHLEGMLPMEIRATSAAASDYLTAAETAKNSFTGNEAAAKLLTDAISKVTEAKDDLASAVYVGDSGYTYTAPEDSKLAAVNTARTYYGAPITGAALVEKELNILQDMAAIANSKTLQAGKLEAYMKLMSTGVHAAVDIQSSEDRDAYQTMRQAKWDLLQAESVDTLNTILDQFGLKRIGETEPEEPEYILGDVDGNGKVEPRDAGLLLQYVNEVIGGDGLDLNAADVDGNGKVEPKDAGYLLQYVNEIIKKLPAEQ